MRRGIAICVLSGIVYASGYASAAIVPYVADANTIALYHFDEAAGAADPGNPFINAGTGGATLNLTNTGGPDGRNNATVGGYGGPAYAGFGSSFRPLLAGDGTNHGAVPTATGGGAITAGTMNQTALQGVDGRFTYEALINISATTAEQQILAHDGNPNRGFLFRVVSGTLDFYNGTASLNALIPTTGTHAFEANQWFHVAVTYDGADATPGNLKFYWTRLDSGVEAANQIGSATLSLASDVVDNPNIFGVGTTTRNQFRAELSGSIDEVRISSVVRGPTDFLFGPAVAVPEPGSFAALAVGAFGLAWTLRRRRANAA
ncbi:MAG: PEP-CTERM sorting domain-containing protein [Pirellulales bacterium]